MAGELERVRKALRELGKLLASLPANPPPKEVHNLRTATRRVEAIAAVLPPGDQKKSRRLLKPIEPVRKAAGDVRDMDVLISHSRRMARYSAGDSLARLVGHLESARNESAAELQRALGHRRKAARDKLGQYSKLVRSALTPAKSDAPNAGQAGQPHEGVHSAAMNVVRELGEWPPLDAGNIHAFRLKVKESALRSATLCRCRSWISSRRSETCSAASATGTTGSNWLRSRERSSIRNRTVRC